MRFKIQLKNKNSGATIVEYAIILSLVGIVCFSALKRLGSTLTVQYNEIGSKVGTDYRPDHTSV